MTSHQPVSYEFGGFTLYPQDQTLLHSNRPVKIAGKEFEILSYFVQHPGTLIRVEEFAVAIWGSEGKKYGRNLPHHISRIRTVIGCDPRVPKYIQTIHAKKGYRFIAPVRAQEGVLQQNHRIELPVSGNATFQLTCHLFVPMFVGPSVYSKVLSKKSNQWIDSKEFKTDKGTLQILPNGFGVWHIIERNKFGHIWEFAEWRKAIYKEILHGRHLISIHTRELLRSGDSELMLNDIRGKPGYVFSAQVLRSTNLRNQEIVDRALQLLAMPSVLEISSVIQAKNGSMNLLERKLLDAKTTEQELNEFGSAGMDKGFACWDGLSYQARSNDSLEQQIVDFEVAVQSAWWMAKCMTDLLLSGEKDGIESARLLIPILKREFAKIRNISAIETPSQRTMIEGVLKTSRLKEVVGTAIELYNDLPK